MTTIHQLKLSLSNAYLVWGDRPVLIDSGSPGEEEHLTKQMAAAGVQPQDLALVIHTHAHNDHAGTSAWLQKQIKVPLAAHPLEAQRMRQGHNGPIRVTGLNGRFIRPFVIKPYAPAETAVPINEGMRLDHLGISGQILTTPGHTPGSISILLDDGQAIIGDLLMGGFLGGTFAAARPRIHYFAENLSAVFQSLQKILATGAHTFYVGHGGPLKRQDILRAFEGKLSGLPSQRSQQAGAIVRL
ncbi:MAG: MBL fold metallo-hydrolase [Ardenticatenaceae bacterium]|nr:MBL fold metallo-hydrolase [Ardenticatenaceae bacterium]